jgi:hypothetical protein
MHAGLLFAPYHKLHQHCLAFDRSRASAAAADGFDNERSVPDLQVSDGRWLSCDVGCCLVWCSVALLLLHAEKSAISHKDAGLALHRLGLGSPLPHLRRDRVCRCHICSGPGLTPCHICTGTLGLQAEMLLLSRSIRETEQNMKVAIPSLSRRHRQCLSRRSPFRPASALRPQRWAAWTPAS